MTSDQALNASGPSSSGPRWIEATIAAVKTRTPTIKSFFLDVPGQRPWRAGQHVDVRLVADDGYEARRSYSIASAPGADQLELMIDRLGDGEVSPWFHDVVVAGDTVEVLGPVGGHFVWRVEQPGPLLLVAGGSGIVPLLSMLRQRSAMDASSAPEACLLYAGRTRGDLACRDELEAMAAADPRLTLRLATSREAPWREGDFGRRVDGAMVAELLAGWNRTPADVYVCGSTGFVETVADGLVDAGVAPAVIRTERYGGTATRGASA